MMRVKEYKKTPLHDSTHYMNMSVCCAHRQKTKKNRRSATSQECAVPPSTFFREPFSGA